MDDLNPLFGLALLLAGIFAVGAPVEVRSRLGVAWVMIAVTWLQTVLSFQAETSLAFAITDLGIYTKVVDVVSLFDTLTAMAIVALAIETGWGRVLSTALFAQLVLHSMHQYGGLAYAPYSDWLDLLFLVQLAVFIFMGRGGLTQCLSSASSHLSALWSSRSAREGTASRASSVGGKAR